MEDLQPQLVTANTAAGTARIQINLFQSDEKRCPELNYREIRNHLAPQLQKNKREDKAKKNNGASNGLKDPFSDNDDDVEKIAKQFEQKYGSSSTYGKKKKRSKINYYADIGAGYDENDSFIDNTDGYDEVVPLECDTAYGGFYINSGSLEFKSVNVKNDTTVQSGDGDDSSPNAPRKTHKRALSTSESDEESSSSNSEASTTKKRTDTETDNAKANGVTDSDKSGDDLKKAKSASTKPAEESSHKKRRKSSQDLPPVDDEIHVTKTVRELLAEARTCVSSNRRREMSPDSGSSDSESKPQAMQSSDNQASSDSSREVPPAPQPPAPPAPAPPQPQQQQQPPPPPQPQQSPAPLQINQPPPLPPLPPNLPQEVVTLARRLKGLADAHFSAHTGKLSGPEVNEIIIGMEKHCRRPGMTPSLRQALFGHAAALLRRGKPGLIQRARRLADEQIKDQQIGGPIERLKAIIEKMKPALLENYKTESQKIIEINKSIVLQNAGLDDDKKLPERRLPKRRFPWNDDVRAVLLEIVEGRGEEVLVSEAAMSRFLHTVVFPLFPPGFVRMPTLIQQSRISLAKKINDISKRPPIKTLDTKILNSQILANKNVSEEKPPQSNEKSVFEPKLPSGTICVGSKIDEKAQQDKSKQYNVGNSQLYVDNVSISIAQKKNSADKTTPTNIGSLTITPVTSTPKEDKSVSPNTEQSSTQVSPGTIKVKSVNALFDKETIAKIISSKNSDTGPKHSTQNRDVHRIKPDVVQQSKIVSPEVSKPHSNSTDLFIKPKSIKTDHPSFGRAYSSTDHQDSDAIRLNKKYPDSSTSNSPYIKSPTSVSSSNNSYSNKPDPYPRNYSNHVNRARPRTDSYDSSSDDCVEIISEDHPTSTTQAKPRDDNGTVPESLQKQFEMQYRAIYSGSPIPDKKTPPKTNDFSIKNIVKESDHSVKHILHQDVSVISKGGGEFEEKSHSVSVIKDNYVNKSDRHREVPEAEVEPITIEQGMDFTRMMQGYKELEDFQLKSPEGLGQRLFDDADNNKFRIPLIPDKSIPNRNPKERDDNLIHKRSLYLDHSSYKVTSGPFQ